ncbi:hypothetical protein FACS18948_1520 [Clostridia bacterium]|nr:hypothetical protein FACS18948_1520 [Clostridia bacterium]
MKYSYKKYTTVPTTKRTIMPSGQTISLPYASGSNAFRLPVGLSAGVNTLVTPNCPTVEDLECEIANQCPPGTHFSEELNACIADNIESGTVCACPDCMHYNPTVGACVYSLIDGVCPEGTRPDGSGTGCVRMPIMTCPPNWRFEESVNGCVRDVICYCVEEPEPEPDDCCVQVAEPICPTGYIYNKTTKKCESTAVVLPPSPAPVPDPDTQDPGCPSGYAFIPTLGICVLEDWLLTCPAAQAYRG